VIWLVQDIDEIKPAWIALGLSDVKEYSNIEFTGEYHGKPTTIYAWEITGRIGNLNIEMIQPAEGQRNAFNDFLSEHGDGIFAIVHKVSTQKERDDEMQRMQGLGVGVLQQLTGKRNNTPVTFTYFDTEPQGKLVLGLIQTSEDTSHGGDDRSLSVSHLGPVIREPTSVSAFWQKLGFPAFSMEHATPREDSRYQGKPLWLTFDAGYQRYTQFDYEWIIPPTQPANIYADFLKAHQEGIQHIGLPVPDLSRAISAYEKLGYHVKQSGAWGEVGKKDSGQYAYMDTDTKGGVSVELLHAH
jgi:catechol 2,3-dioxygenase-like lactoylglutathione lyase family enzyme